MDIVSSSMRSRMMSGIRSRNTRPEVTLRKILHAQGFRYRLGTKILQITPDIVLPKYKTAIFLHGCFWHRHPDCKYSTSPKSNSDKWQKKFKENLNRDERVVAALLATGWRVAVVWECWEKRKLDISWLFPWIEECAMNFVSWPLVNDAPQRDS